MKKEKFRKPGKGFVDQMRIEPESSDFPPKFGLTPTLQKLQAGFGPDTPVSTFDLARNILEMHPEYGEGKAANVYLDETASNLSPRPFDKWLGEIRKRFDLIRISDIDGRVMLAGLGLIDSSLRAQLEENGFWDSLLSELEPSLKEIITKSGTKRQRGTLPAEVKPQPDNALERMEQDKLGREAFAGYLARLISGISGEEGSYAIHLYGPWGSGKTTLLNFLREQLQNLNEGGIGSRWIVVNFNAWRNQHAPLPWWALLQNIYRECRGKLNCWDWFREAWWRFCAGNRSFLLNVVIIVVFAWIVAWKVGWPKGDSYKWVSSILALVLTLWGIISTTARFLVFGSAKSAQSFVDATTGPMRTIKKRFEDLVNRIHPYRLAILIDDLDRCSGEYVLKLLEGIQTLFRDAPVVFVVAADRRWLNACYEAGYEYFKPLVHADGKSLGTLFLEKTFQLSTPVPGVPQEVKEGFWSHLLGIKSKEGKEDLRDAEEKAKQLVKDAGESGDVMRILTESRNLKPVEEDMLRRAVVLELATPKELEYTEHALKKFVTLIESNPRSMKRLVNAYNTYRAVATLSYVDISPDQLALWTILSIRWPMLANTLMDALEETDDGLKINVDRLGEECRLLLADENVKKILRGGDEFGPLEIDTIRKFSRFRY